MSNILDQAGDPPPENSGDGNPPPAEPAQSTSIRDFIGDDGKFNENLVDKYAEYDPDVDKEAFKNFMTSNENDFNRVMKASLNLNKMLGKNKIPWPGDNASDEDMAAFWQQAGAPKEGEEYKISDENKELFTDESVLKGLLEIGHKAHIPQKLMNQLVPLIGESLKESATQAVENSEEVQRQAIAALEPEFGRNGTPEFQGNIALAGKGLRILAADYEAENFAELAEKYGNDPFLLRLFRDKAIASGENTAPPGSTDGQLTTVTSLKEQVDAANRKYQESPNEQNLNKVLELREKLNKLENS